MTEPIRSDLLLAQNIAHGFFTRHGGVSQGLYASLNGGVGSKDDAAAVAENRRRMAASLGVTHLLVPYQIHSPDAMIVEAAFTPDERPRCDALVTRTRNIGLGVTGADCGIVLFADADAQVIGAAHAGWKGALTGVLEATLDAMERQGAARGNIKAVLGPTIGQNSYEVGPEFFDRFIADDKDYASFFASSTRQNHRLFDLPGFIGFRLQRAGIGAFENLGLDTYADDARFYSYRRSVHRQEEDYGRLVAAIALV
ncbi:polyphenol oxidase family protein [Methylovirgula sp. HY1]|uniref:polyphenol oxidase family protein n=1 Tax=Methylovirgula sp. HY1 TaxID=2822761 RepID=UPI001C5B60A1|nr:polyphenol oxidase family protein [Methylovirgula sp. HY1]QXX75419.1 Laccase domain protein YfiH [Methylovirgula sp. HY1]